MTETRSAQFFDQQFQRQVAAADYALNPFEIEALPHLRGSDLDYGCGLGNLSLEAARRGCSVLALDASPSAIEHIRYVANQDTLTLRAEEADLRTFELAEDFDSIVCIGLLMFFDCPSAYRQLSQLRDHLRPGGVAVVNVLVEGTTFMDMFAPEGHCLFQPVEFLAQFVGWEVLSYSTQEFSAPGNTRKVFATAIMRKPHAPRADGAGLSVP